MKNFLRLASLAALVVGATTLSTGCIVSECETGEDEDAAGNCVQLEGITFYEGAPRTETLDYTAGTNLTVDGFNGDIVVRDGAPADQVIVTFFPKTGRRANEAAEAGEEIANSLNLAATADANGVAVATSRSNNNTYLSAQIEVQLPASFTGRITITQGNGEVDAVLTGIDEAHLTIDNNGAGDVDVSGLNAPDFFIEGDFDVNVGVEVFPTADSSIGATGGTGDVFVSVPAASDGSIQATSSDSEPVTGPSPLPAGWTEDAAAENSKTYGLGAGGANLRIFTDANGLGGVTIATN